MFVDIPVHVAMLELICFKCPQSTSIWLSPYCALKQNILCGTFQFLAQYSCTSSNCITTWFLLIGNCVPMQTGLTPLIDNISLAIFSLILYYFRPTRLSNILIFTNPHSIKIFGVSQNYTMLTIFCNVPLGPKPVTNTSKQYRRLSV